jgi:hypothetical protein
MNLSFDGPYSWADASEAPEASEFGIYLWTVPSQSGHLVYYVGETGVSFSKRLREHNRDHCAAKHRIYKAAEFAQGRKVKLWHGVWNPGPDHKSPEECLANSARLSKSIQEMLGVMQVFLAPLKTDERTRKRIEGAILRSLYAVPGTFMLEGVSKPSPRKGLEEPIECTITSPVPLFGMPQRVEA